MKKILILIVSSIFIFNRALALNTTASQAIIYDYETKTVIFEKNSKELVSPSSMSKIMTIYYLFKKLKDNFYILRPTHWLKNLVIFLPLFFDLIINDRILVSSELFQLIKVFFLFCLFASCVYIINDLI